MKTFVGAVMAASIAIPALASEPTYSGFLSNYDNFVDGPEGGVSKVWINPRFTFPDDLKGYQSLYFDPIAVKLSADGAKRGVDVAELAQLAKTLEAKIAEELSSGGYKLASKSGPKSLRFVVALTDVEPSNPVLDTVTSVVPFARVMSFAKSKITGEHSFTGSASIEGLAIDMGTNETVFAFVDKRAGDKGIFGGVDSMEDVHEAFEFWAGRLRIVLDEAHGR